MSKPCIDFPVGAPDDPEVGDVFECHESGDEYTWTGDDWVLRMFMPVKPKKVWLNKSIFLHGLDALDELGEDGWEPYSVVLMDVGSLKAFLKKCVDKY